MLRVLKISLRFNSGTSAGVSTSNFKDNLSGNQIMNNSQTKENMPVQMTNPFTKEKRLCILCKYKITPDYKNVRLLSQFVSRFTGKVYGKHITGLCDNQQVLLEEELSKSIKCGLMPSYYKVAQFAKDPKLCDPDNPFRPHRY